MSQMARTMSCRDVGPDCDFVARGETDEEVMGQVAEHARTAHDMEEVPPELAEKAQAAIRDEA
jgi:predicted small metal-binding protein